MDLTKSVSFKSYGDKTIFFNGLKVSLQVRKAGKVMVCVCVHVEEGEGAGFRHT